MASYNSTIEFAPHQLPINQSVQCTPSAVNGWHINVTGTVHPMNSATPTVRIHQLARRTATQLIATSSNNTSDARYRRKSRIATNLKILRKILERVAITQNESHKSMCNVAYSHSRTNSNLQNMRAVKCKNNMKLVYHTHSALTSQFISCFMANAQSSRNQWRTSEWLSAEIAAEGSASFTRETNDTLRQHWKYQLHTTQQVTGGFVL